MNTNANVTVICYGQREIWRTRKEAMQFYLECMAGSEGAERDRYTNIYLDLSEGKMVCSDGEEEYHEPCNKIRTYGGQQA